MSAIKNMSQTLDIELNEVSSINNPKDNTVLFITNAYKDKLQNLQIAKGCLVFLEEGIESPIAMDREHIFVYTQNPALEYALYTQRIAKNEDERNQMHEYRLHENGYYYGEDITIGDNTYIEPGAQIGHGVTIGKDTHILSYAVIKNACIGDNCLIKNHAQIGGQAFTFATDNEGNRIRIPCLGRVIIEDCVEIGSFSTINRGLNSETRICRYAKLDDHVAIGHDAVIGSNTLIVAGAVLGGYVSVGESVYIGLNVSIKNRVRIESNVTLSMGSRVVKDVKADSGVYGVPKTNT